MKLKTTNNSRLKSKFNRCEMKVRREDAIKFKPVVRKNNTYLTQKATPEEKIKTSTVKNRREKLDIKKVPGNVVRFTGKGIKTRINDFADKKLLKEVQLDTQYENEIGANTLKTMYNVPLKTVKGSRAVTEGAKTTIQEIKTIAHTVRDMPDTLKTTTKAISNKQTNVYKNIRQKNLKGALGEIKDGTKFLGAGAFNFLSRTGKFSKKISIKGVGRLGNSLKSSALTKSDETSDMGANAVLTTTKALKETAKGGIKGTRGAYRTIKTAKINKVAPTNAKIKTKAAKGGVPKDIRKYFNKFKNSYASKKEIKKYINKISKKITTVVKKIATTTIKNPFVIGIIAIALALILFMLSILTALFGAHASYFIEIEPNQAKWISSMEKMDKSVRDKTKQYKNVKILQNSGDSADWRDIIIAYYMLNNNSASLAGATTSLDGDMASVDPETWEKVYAELSSYLGTPYVWGGSDPSTGFDCSGLVQYCYNKYGISLPRTTYEQVLCGVHVERADLKAGDLVFFGTAADVHHVGVYIGNNQYLHAPATGDVVKISDLNGRSDFYEGRRVFQETEANTPEDNNHNNNDNDKILYQALPNHKEFVDIFYRVGAETGVDPILLASIAQTESSMNPLCVSSAGASGLCQMMPATFVYLGFNLADIFDPYTNVLACAYEIMDLYRYSCIKSVEDMLTAYNGGIGNFMKYNGPIPGNKENMEYSGKVLGNYSLFSNGQQPSTMEGGFTNGVNTKLAKVYTAFVKLYKKENSEQWVLQYYTIDEALNNLGFTKEEKIEFFNFKEYNEDFMEDEQFKGYDVNFKFNI